MRKSKETKPSPFKAVEIGRRSQLNGFYLIQIFDMILSEIFNLSGFSILFTALFFLLLTLGFYPFSSKTEIYKWCSLTPEKKKKA
jgi:hypothetical protein